MTERPRGADGRFVRRPSAATIDLPPAAPAELETPSGKLDKRGRTQFLQSLAETSNVSRSAEAAGVAPGLAYKARREDAKFAAQWRDALYEGYDNLEMEVLGFLRDPAPAQKMDVTVAMRLLVAHRETVARERALREDDDEQAVLESIDAFIDQMRERRAANTAILAEADSGNGAR